jgi:lysophospholipid acyltransferase (LPLAT)-like uncharacterized protein
MRWALGYFIGLIARLWTSTLRITTVTDPALAAVGDRPWVLALWHGQQLLLVGHARRRSAVALVSLSSDGELLAAAFPRFGLSIARGSSSRGGARGLAHVVRRLRAGEDAAIALDGPRGPHRVVRATGGRAGAAVAAERARGVVVPYVAAASRSVSLASWDRFELPLPFSRVVVALGAPIEPERALPGALAAELTRTLAIAAQRLGGESPVVSAHVARSPNGR